jgi:hypothetical protein
MGAFPHLPRSLCTRSISSCRTPFRVRLRHTLDAPIRGHWKIETTSHYSRDVTLGEDKSRIRTNPGVFARLRSFAFNILKSNKTSTLCQDRYRAALAGIDNLLEVLAIP